MFRPQGVTDECSRSRRTVFREDGAPLFVGGWLLQIAGHRLFEHNLPSTHKGWITYQLTGVIHVCEQYGELLTRHSRRKAAAKVLT
jgi:hypothetical protein